MLQIDVRTVLPGQRHQRVIDAFESLQVGDALELTAPHDPRGLRGDFDDLYVGTFNWECISEDPGAWRIRIRKTASTSAADDIETIIANDEFQVLRVSLAAGTAPPEHHIPESVIVVCTAGIVRLSGGEGLSSLKPGEVKAIAPNAPHSVASENGATVIIVRIRKPEARAQGQPTAAG